MSTESDSSILHSIEVQPVPFILVKRLIEREHYLHSLPGGTKIAFGIYFGKNLSGAVSLGVGPTNAHCLVRGAVPDNSLTLTRLWLSSDLPRNSESRVIGIIIKALCRHTDLKFLVSYADPSAGHIGTIYQACGWLYTGLSTSMPLYKTHDGKLHHSRSLAHHYGSHSIRYLMSQGVEIKVIDQTPKYRYIKFLDRSWQQRLIPPILPYPKKGKSENEGH
jgi:hypothetical protein